MTVLSDKLSATVVIDIPPKFPSGGLSIDVLAFSMCSVWLVASLMGKTNRMGIIMEASGAGGCSITSYRGRSVPIDQPWVDYYYY